MAVVRGLKRRLGRRGAFLLLFGSAWLLLGYGWLAQDPSENTRLGTAVLVEVAPFWVWAIVWLAGGLVAVASAFRRRPGQDTWGFVALITPPLVWALSYFAAYLVTGWARGWRTAAIFGVVSGAVLIVSGWPEPTEPHKTGDQEQR